MGKRYDKGISALILFVLWTTVLVAGESAKKPTDGPLSPIDPRAKEVIQKLKSALQNVGEGQAEQAAATGALAELGKLGPTAAPTVPYLLSEEFFKVKGGEETRNHPLRLATIDTIIKIGKPAVPEVISMLTRKSEYQKQTKKEEMFSWKFWGDHILRKMAMSRPELADSIAESVVAKARSAGRQGQLFYSTLAQLGPISLPYFKEELRKNPGQVKGFVQYIGKEVGDAIDRFIPGHYTVDTWEGANRNPYWIHYRGGWYPRAHAGPGPKHVPAFLDLIKDEEFMVSRYWPGIRNVGLLLNAVGKPAVLPTAELLQDENLRIRRAAAYILRMMGPAAIEAVPALEACLNNKKEEVRVRAAAARALVNIQGTDPSQLYRKISGLDQKIVDASLNASREAQSESLWNDLLDGNGEFRVRHLQLYKQDPNAQKAVYKLAKGIDLKAQNEWLRDYNRKVFTPKPKAKPTEEFQVKPLEGMSGDNDITNLLLLFHKHSQHYPGRLEPNVERAMKENVFGLLDRFGRDGHEGEEVFKLPWYRRDGVEKTTADLTLIIESSDDYIIIHNRNIDFRADTPAYLICQILNSDPDFRNRKFKAGDTVAQRYETFCEYMCRGLKQWALHGLWQELGSTNYEHKNYRPLLQIVEFSTDRRVADISRMYLDICFMEIEQISMNHLRGGSKTRAKDGGLFGRFDSYTAMFYGDHHSYMLEPLGFKGYRPPVPAILFRHLGPPTPVYEIANRHPGEWTISKDNIRQYFRRYIAKSRSVNYAYSTPEYVSGCAMYDIRLWLDPQGADKVYPNAYHALGRWSGVIFRDASSVNFGAYSGEKWFAHSKDVVIGQRYRRSTYKGEAKVEFAGSLDVSEKDGWVFADNKDSYAAVNIPRGGYFWDGPARFNLYLNDQYSPIIIQTGRKTDYGSFENFQKAILAAPLKITEDVLDYTGPKSSRIEFFMCKDSDTDPYPKSLPKIDGNELDLNLKHNYKSPYINNAVGSDIVTVSYGDRKWEYDFEKNTITDSRNQTNLAALQRTLTDTNQSNGIRLRAAREIAKITDESVFEVASVIKGIQGYLSKGEMENHLDCFNLCGDKSKAVQHLYKTAYKILEATPNASYSDLSKHGEILKSCADIGLTHFGGPLLGAVTADGVRVWLRTLKPADVTVKVMVNGIEKSFCPVRSSVKSDLVAIVPVTGLRANTRYSYQVMVGGKPINIPESAQLMTAPEPVQSGKVRIAFGSCFHRWGLGNQALSDTIVSRIPSAMLLLGDIAGQDRNNHIGLHRSDYLMRDLQPAWQKLAANVPVYVTWDDHDYFDNDKSGIPLPNAKRGHPAYTDEDRRTVWNVFRECWNNPSYGFGEEQQGVFLRTRIGPCDIIMTDNRYFREHKKGSFLGDAQMKWLKEQLLDCKGPFIILSCGTMWSDYVSGGKDSWGKWDPEGREEIFSFIEKKRIGGVILLSGDRHGARGFRIKRPAGYTFYEFEAASLGGRWGPGKETGNPMNLFGFDKVFAFGELTIDATLSDPEVTMRLIQDNGTELYELTLKRSQLTPVGN